MLSRKLPGDHTEGATPARPGLRSAQAGDPIRIPGAARFDFDNLIVASLAGDHTGGATPEPIPNSEVKPSKADGTYPARDWESR